MPYIGIILVLLVSIKPLKAAQFCVGTEFEFRSALMAAEMNNQDDEIRIKLGVIETNGSPFNYDSTQGDDLKITGSWLSFSGDGCGFQSPNEPLGSVLDGMNQDQILRIFADGAANITVGNLAFVNGKTAVRAAGLYITSASGSNFNSITLHNNSFSNHEADFTPAFSVGGAHLITVRNNLITNNQTVIAGSLGVNQTDGTGIYFTNNTLVFNNAVADANASAAFLIDGTSKLLVANNILNNNVGTDLIVFNEGGGDYFLWNNNVDDRGGANPTSDENNVHLPNRFKPGILSFVPDFDSPLIDSGRPPCGLLCPAPTPFEYAWDLGDADILAQARVQGERVDIGAFESAEIRDIIFMSRF